MARAYDPLAGDRAIFDALIDARDKYGAKKPILEDQERNPLSYTDLIRAAFALGRKIAGMTEKGERVAVLLPSSVGVVVTFFALHAFGRVPVMLNFTAGIRNLRLACKTAGVRRILTAHRFINQGKLEDLIDRILLTDDGAAQPFVRYLIAADQQLAAEPIEALLAGEVTWPPVST